MNTCGFCGNTTGVRTLVIKNGYNVKQSIPLITCGPCTDLITEIALALSLYVTVD